MGDFWYVDSVGIGSDGIWDDLWHVSCEGMYGGLMKCGLWRVYMGINELYAV